MDAARDAGTIQNIILYSCIILSAVDALLVLLCCCCWNWFVGWAAVLCCCLSPLQRWVDQTEIKRDIA